MLSLNAVDLEAVWDRVVRGETDTDRLLPRKKVFIRLDSDVSDIRINEEQPMSTSFEITRKTNHPCWWCRRPEAPLGIPENILVDDVTHFFVHGNFCSFNCAMAYCLSEKIPESQIILLKKMFRTMHPNEEIHVAPHWTLLHSNGGVLSDEEFDGAIHRYVRTSSLIQHPVTHEWMRYRSC